MTEQSRRILHVIVEPNSQDPNGHEMRLAVEKLQSFITGREEAGDRQPTHLLPIDTQFEWETEVHNIIVFAANEPVGVAQFAHVEYEISGMDEDGEDDCQTVTKYFNMLHTLYVHPDYRRQGYGRMLMNAMAACCERTTHTEMDVAPDNVDAIAFYKSCGYITESVRMVLHNANVVEMDSELDAPMDSPLLITFGQATDEEITQLHAKHAEEFPLERLEIIRPDHAKGYSSYAARMDNQIVGLAQVLVFGDPHPTELRRLFVVPEYRMIGVARSLCEFIASETGSCDYLGVDATHVPHYASSVMHPENLPIRVRDTVIQ